MGWNVKLILILASQISPKHIWNTFKTRCYIIIFLNRVVPLYHFNTYFWLQNIIWQTDILVQCFILHRFIIKIKKMLKDLVRLLVYTFYFSLNSCTIIGWFGYKITLFIRMNLKTLQQVKKRQWQKTPHYVIFFT